jgi:hypothetical protein
MASEKNSSSVVEKCIEYFNINEREEVVEELLFGKKERLGSDGGDNGVDYNNNNFYHNNNSVNSNNKNSNVYITEIPFFQLLCNPNSVYVIQKAFDFSSLKMKKKINDAVKPIMYDLGRMPGGKHLKGRLKQIQVGKI